MDKMEELTLFRDGNHCLLFSLSELSELSFKLGNVQTIFLIVFFRIGYSFLASSIALSILFMFFFFFKGIVRFEINY